MWSFVKLMFWGLIWLVTWPLVTVYRTVAEKPRIDNCFTWAIRRWQEEPDSYLVIRWCRSNQLKWIRWPHFLWLPADKHEHVRHFLPKSNEQGTSLFPDAFFEGKVVTGDNEDEMEN